MKIKEKKAGDVQNTDHARLFAVAPVPVGPVHRK